MDTAIEHFKSILKTAIDRETCSLKSEISSLKDQLANLTDQLTQKDEECRRLFHLLRTKNAEWKSIKEKLLRGRRRKLEEEEEMVGVEEGKDDLGESIQLTNVESNIHVNTTETLSDKFNNNSKYDFKDENSNIPVHKNEDADDTECDSPNISILPEIETRSNFDALISLISESENGHENETCEISNNNNSNNNNNNNNQPIHSENIITNRLTGDISFTSVEGKRKRKSHARGCSCCEKYYSATRPSTTITPTPPIPTNATSFLVSPNTPPGFWDTSFTPRQ